MTVKEVKRKMDELGLRQVDLSRMWRLQPATIHKYIHREFNSEDLDRRLAKLFSMTLEEFRGEGKAA